MAEKTKKTYVRPECEDLQFPVVEGSPMRVASVCVNGAAAGPHNPDACASGSGAIRSCSGGNSYGSYCGSGVGF
jgi:hypothetical protein